MTTRVFDFRQRPLASFAGSPARGRPDASGRAGGRKGAALVALVVVPLASVGEGPTVWIATGLTALGLVLLAALRGRRFVWGWLALLAGAVGLALPRGPLGNVGPAMFVGTIMCMVLWAIYAADDDPSHQERARRAAQRIAGLSGERHVGRVLASELPQDYALINGLKLPRGAGDIDHLVVGPTGVFLLETKTMAGRVSCASDGTWRRTRIGRDGAAYAAYIGDPAAQVQRNIFAVRQVLRERRPELLGGTGLWIEGLIVFAHPKTSLEAETSRVPAVLLADTSSRICTHAPRRKLQPHEVDLIVTAVLMEAYSRRFAAARQAAQSLVELAVLLPVVLLLVFGIVGLSRYVQTHTAVVAVANEAARAGALAGSPAEAVDRMRQRADLVATGLGLNAGDVVLTWDLTRFGDRPGQVEATVAYPVAYGDLPMLGSLFPTEVRAEHVEWVDPFRSGMSGQSGGRR